MKIFKSSELVSIYSNLFVLLPMKIFLILLNIRILFIFIIVTGIECKVIIFI